MLGVIEQGACEDRATSYLIPDLLASEGDSPRERERAVQGTHQVGECPGFQVRADMLSLYMPRVRSSPTQWPLSPSTNAVLQGLRTQRFGNL